VGLRLWLSLRLAALGLPPVLVFSLTLACLIVW
jgi:hypothetical protein